MGMEKATATSSPGRKVLLVQLLHGLEVVMIAATTTNREMVAQLHRGPQVAMEATITEVTVNSRVDMEHLQVGLVGLLHGSDNRKLPLHPHQADKTTGTVDILAATAVLGDMEVSRAWELLLALVVALAVWVLLLVSRPCTRAMVPTAQMERRPLRLEKLLLHR